MILAGEKLLMNTLMVPIKISNGQMFKLNLLQSWRLCFKTPKENFLKLK